MLSSPFFRFGAAVIAAQLPQFTDIIAIIGLPRSGTTLAASLFDAHPDTITCYEPWNRSDGAGLSGTMSPQDMIELFKLERDPAAKVLVIKETSVDLDGLRWLMDFMAHNAPTHRVQVVWTLRCLRHTYLSFVEGAQKWWGQPDREVNPADYDKWVSRSCRSMAVLVETYQQFPGVIYAYEAMAAKPAQVIPAMMQALELEFSERQLDYSSHIARKQIRGDLNLTREQAPVSANSVAKREQEWASYATALLGADTNNQRQKLDDFWQSVYQQDLMAGSMSAADATTIQEQSKVLRKHRTGEFRVALRGLDHWRKVVKENPFLRNDAWLEDHAARIRGKGFNFRGQPVPIAEVTRTGGNLREGLSHRGLNSRKRAVLTELHLDLSQRDRPQREARIYAPEATTGFSDYLRQNFDHLETSEYLPEGSRDPKLKKVQHQDLGALSFANDSFDYVLVNDIFEHVPDLDRVLAEIARVLLPGGILLATFPFRVAHSDHLLRARMDNQGNIEHILDPEYHDDPVSAEGALVFKVPGWQILQDCRQQGFNRAQMVLVCSPARGILANNTAGVLVLKASKAP